MYCPIWVKFDMRNIKLMPLCIHECCEVSYWEHNTFFYGCTCTIKSCILKVKNTLIKSLLYVTDYTICKHVITGISILK